MIKETPSLDGVRVTECVPASEIFSGRRRYRFRAAVAVVSFFKKKHNQFKFFYLFIFCSTLPHRHRCLSITPRMSLIFFFVFLSFFLGTAPNRFGPVRRGRGPLRPRHSRLSVEFARPLENRPRCRWSMILSLSLSPSTSMRTPLKPKPNVFPVGIKGQTKGQGRDRGV